MPQSPLAGVRIIESSMLGPGAITTHLADLGADVIKVEPPQGDYVRQMTWPIVEGVSLMHLHISRGKRSDRARPAHRRGRRRRILDLVRDADAVIEAMRPGGLERRGLGYERLREVNPRDRVLHDLRLRHDRPVQGHAEPRHRLRRVGRPREARDRRGRLRVHPRAPVDRHPRRAAVRRARRARRRHPGPGDRRGLPARDRAVRRRGRDGLAAQRDVQGLRAARVRGHRQQVRQLRAPGAGHRRHARRRPLPVLRDDRRPRPVHGVRARVLEELLPRASTGPTCSRS